MKLWKSGLVTVAGVLVAGQVFAHGTESTSGVLTPAVKPVPWWHFLMSGAEAAASFSVSQADGYRFIKTDSLPNHNTGSFPGRGNPHAIKSHDRSYRVKLNPEKSNRMTPVGHNLFGIALNGVVFDAATAEYWNNDRNWNIEAIVGGQNLGIDNSNAHVQPDGTYHYHGVPTALFNSFDYKNKPVLLGYAADGFPIYGPNGYSDPSNPSSGLKKLMPSWKVKSGTRPSGPGGSYSGKYTADWEYVRGAGDLDECNGRVAVTPEYPNGIYHYVVTREFPNIGRCWVGSPDNSFKKQRGGGGPGGGQAGNRPGGQQRGTMPQGGQQRGGMPQGGQQRGGMGGPGGGPGAGMGGPPQGALDACRGAQEGDTCSFQGRSGKVDSQCMVIPTGDMACAPPHMVGGGGMRGPGGPGGPGGRRPN